MAIRVKRVKAIVVVPTMIAITGVGMSRISNL